MSENRKPRRMDLSSKLPGMSACHSSLSSSPFACLQLRLDLDRAVLPSDAVIRF
ncbi:hypothetical protein [Mesorhizobium dulcispinae]|uniref:hypothetical protein n=1 Tax=Mesorhizobium dulcispinae TaxID=3072316 RepID=UPI002A2404EA|nr:hypothetical protein [Mesorhizobium sp. VK23D]MDX8520173.1 hypothetical protein [Mesorhizobium sp. VK23D]